MNVFDFALKMELDGERYYREQAAKVKYEDLKVLLEGLADDEQRHYKIVEMLQNSNVDFLEADRTISKTTNIFEIGKNKEFMPKNKDSIAKLKNEQLDVYQAALLKEEESVKIYKKLRETVEQQAEKEILKKLMHEEEKHAEVLCNIIEMLNHVNEWVESPEFYHQKPY